MPSTKRKAVRKREKRTHAALPVRVNFMHDGSTQQACTLNITSKGARLAGLNLTPEIGDLLEIQRGRKKDLFRIVWVGDPLSDTEGQVGVVIEGKEVSIWEGSQLKQRGFEPVPEAPPPPPGIMLHGTTAAKKAAVERPVPVQAPAAQAAGSRRAIWWAVAGLVLLLVGIYLGKQTVSKSGSAAPVSAGAAQPRTPIDPKEAAQVHDLSSWRVASIADFDGQGVTWMRAQNIDPVGVINFHASEENGGSAYLLVSTAPATRSMKWRLLVFINHQLHYDTSMPQIFAAAVVPAASLSQVTWQDGSRPVAATGDGIMIVRDGNDQASAVIFEVSGSRILPRQPANFRSVPLQIQ